MNTSVSPIPLPLWPMLALSLTLFGLTATAVTISAHYTRQLYASDDSNTIEIAAPPPDVPPHTNSRPLF